MAAQTDSGEFSGAASADPQAAVARLLGKRNNNKRKRSVCREGRLGGFGGVAVFLALSKPQQKQRVKQSLRAVAS